MRGFFKRLFYDETGFIRTHTPWTAVTVFAAVVWAVVHTGIYIGSGACSYGESWFNFLKWEPAPNSVYYTLMQIPDEFGTPSRATVLRIYRSVLSDYNLEELKNFRPYHVKRCSDVVYERFGYLMHDDFTKVTEEVLGTASFAHFNVPQESYELQ